jgi:hypothetical protein
MPCASFAQKPARMQFLPRAAGFAFVLLSCVTMGPSDCLDPGYPLNNDFSRPMKSRAKPASKRSSEGKIPPLHDWRTSDEDEINRRRLRAVEEQPRITNTDPREKVLQAGDELEVGIPQ